MFINQGEIVDIADIYQHREKLLNGSIQRLNMMNEMDSTASPLSSGEGYKIVYTEEIKEKETAHNAIFSILGIVDKPFNPYGEYTTWDAFPAVLLAYVQQISRDGKSECEYLYKCYHSILDKKRDYSGNMEHVPFSIGDKRMTRYLLFWETQVLGLASVSLLKYCMKELDPTLFLDQFFPLLSDSVITPTFLDYFLEYVKERNLLDDILFHVYGRIYNQAVNAIQMCDIDSMISAISNLVIMVKQKLARVRLVSLFHIGDSSSPSTVVIRDYLAPFFDLHMCDIRYTAKLLRGDVLTIPGINELHGLSKQLADATRIMNHIQYELIWELLKGETRQNTLAWIEGKCLSNNELMKSRVNYHLNVSMSCMLNLEAVAMLLSEKIMNKNQYPDFSYLLSDDPLLVNEDRFMHDIDKSIFVQDHTEYKFSSRIIWLLLSLMRRGFRHLLDLRERVVISLNRILPNGYNSIGSIAAHNIDEVKAMIPIDFSSLSFFVQNENVMKWLQLASYLASYIVSAQHNDDCDGVTYIPLLALNTVTSILSLFQQFNYPENVYLQEYTQPILVALIQALSYSSGSIGFYLNVHTKADIAKCVYSVYLPSKQDTQYELSQQNTRASDVLSDSDAINVLLHGIIQLFTDVEKIGIESSQYRQYCMTILRFIWNNPRCQKTIIDMKNETEVITNFAASLILTFSKLADDAFSNIGEIKGEMAAMLQPEFMKLEEAERDDKEMHLNQLIMSVRYSFSLTVEILRLLLDAAKPWGEIWMNRTVITPLAIALPQLVKQLVGKNSSSLKIEDPQKYNFNPDLLLSLLISVILIFCEDDKFILKMTEEGTLDVAVLQKAYRICYKRSLLSMSDLSLLKGFLDSVSKNSQQFSTIDEIINSAPDEFIDEMTGELMSDPVELPNSHVIMDLSTIERVLMRSEEDPYDRTHLTKDMLIKRSDIKEKIEQWKKNVNYPDL